MSYHIYTTEGLILSARDWGESDRILNIMTCDLGLVRATALGIRKVDSKLRGALEPFTLSKISLVRGKEFWRLTSAEVIKIFPNDLTIARPLNLLEKLVTGESAHAELFNGIINKLHKEQTEDFEISLVAEILYHLGYLKSDDLSLGRVDLIKAINSGLEASHLVNRV